MRRRDDEQRNRTLLEARLAELMAALRRREDITIEAAADEMDSLQSAAQRELALSYLHMGSSLQRSIRAALRRIEDRSYGTCLHCEKPIPAKRLQAVPWAAYCVHCQEAIDRGELDEEPAPGDTEETDAAYPDPMAVDFG